ncbi:MAG TPA: hypothetical protein VKZ63_17260 [Kofleriaceae bacterium]|nr:hypothetical protein [Kofleriaceae bacterium]
MDTARRRPRIHLAELWGVLGFTAILAQAIVRLTPLALEPIRAGGMAAWHGALYALSIAFNAYSEGYRAFQCKVAPRVVARALHLGERGRPLHVLLAPLFVTGLFHATRRRMITTWVFYAALIAVIVLVRQVPQPWRGMIDAGVVVGLLWGVLAILWVYARALAGHPPAASAELPEEDQRRR